jgi:holo-[acyl-carrier protein] synthase
MIFGIGTDILEIDRIRDSINGLDKLANRICTEFELTEYNTVNTDNKAVYLAKKWASKEAISKAFGTGIQGDTQFKNIEIRHTPTGQPTVIFYNKLKNFIDTLNARCYISISDTDNTVIAYSIIEYNQR